MANTTTLTYTDLIVPYSEFAAGTGQVDRIAQIDYWIQVAGREINTTVFGDQADFAVLSLSAHMIAMADRNNKAHQGGAGPVTAKTTGESIISYGQVRGGDGYSQYRTTSYGMTYLQILLNLDITPLVT